MWKKLSELLVAGEYEQAKKLADAQRKKVNHSKNKSRQGLKAKNKLPPNEPDPAQ
jgi:hypothetical protein